MKIAMLAHHACVRVQKMALPLLARGHEVHLVAFRQPAGVEYYDTFTSCFTVKNMRRMVQVLAPQIDVFHAHNEPSWFVQLVKEVCDTPVILDVHDSFAARMTSDEEALLRDQGQDVFRISTEERNNFQLADALVFPGAQFAELVTHEFALTQPSLVLPSYMCERWYRYNTEEWLGGLVYEGRIDLPSELKQYGGSHGFRYCDYLACAERAHQLGIQVHLYSTRYDQPYRDLYEPVAFVHQSKAFERLPKWLSRHDWGLVGNLTATPEWDVALPNKLFEYIAACVPVVALNAPACAAYVEAEGIGIGVKSLEELRDRWQEHERCRRTLLTIRRRLSMEAHIHTLEGLYARVCGAA